MCTTLEELEWAAEPYECAIVFKPATLPFFLFHAEMLSKEKGYEVWTFVPPDTGMVKSLED